MKSTGGFTIPGLCKIKTRVKPATKARKREVFGKVMMVKAKPTRKIVKAFPVSALKIITPLFKLNALSLSTSEFQFLPPSLQ